MSAASRGHDRERKVRETLEAIGWWVSRAAGSLGDADLVALKQGELPMLIEVKANVSGGPFMNFRRPEREALIAAAVRAGAIPWLAYWPSRKPLRWISVAEWPPTCESGAPEGAPLEDRQINRDEG